MREIIQMIAESLVDSPEKVSVEEINGNNTTVIELCVAKHDLGKVIGKQGRTADAIRQILYSISCKEKKRTVLEIVE